MRSNARPILFGGNAGKRRKGYRRCKHSQRITNSEYLLVTDGPLCTKEVKSHTRHVRIKERTSVEISYTMYRFKMNPWCPKKLTLTVSCFFHQSFGSPEPDKLDVTPFAPTICRVIGSLAAEVFPNADGYLGFVLHGSSEYVGILTGAENDGGSLSISTMGSGRAFWDPNAATCSMLTS